MRLKPAIFNQSGIFLNWYEVFLELTPLSSKLILPIILLPSFNITVHNKAGAPFPGSLISGVCIVGVANG